MMDKEALLELAERLDRWRENTGHVGGGDRCIARASAALRQAGARIVALEATLGEIRDRDWIENALDPQWPADRARVLLNSTDEAKAA